MTSQANDDVMTLEEEAVGISSVLHTEYSEENREEYYYQCQTSVTHIWKYKPLVLLLVAFKFLRFLCCKVIHYGELGVSYYMNK